MIISVMYQVGPGQKFDLDYYVETHMPLVESLWKPAGLKGVEILKGISAPGGMAAPFDVIVLMDFESLDAFTAAAAGHGNEILGDIPNFTDVQPTIQFNDRLVG